LAQVKKCNKFAIIIFFLIKDDAVKDNCQEFVVFLGTTV
jgi:hypothetical protein